MAGEKIMQDKVAVVTGGGRGVGRGIAMLLAKEGAKVVVNDLGASLGGEGEDTGPAQEVASEIQAAGGEAVASTDSVTEHANAEKIIQAALDNFGRIDVVVNNAGILRDALFHKMTEEEWDQVISVHLKGSFNVAHVAAPHFRTQESGTYVHMTSISGLLGNLGQANYSAAKLGIVGLSRSIAIDMARYNVRSNCMSPSGFTRMIESIPIKSDEQAREFERRKKLMSPDMNAPLAVYLASDLAKDVTGQIFATQGNRYFLFNQTRPIAMECQDDWTPAQVGEALIAAHKDELTPLETIPDIMPPL